MTIENWPATMAEVFAHEGGYVNHSKDPGGATNMGITHGTLSSWLGRRATLDDVRNLSKEMATAIYKANYWDKVKGDELPAGLDYVAFDAAVNSGPVRGIRWLQEGLGVSPDGIIGPVTLEAAWGVSDEAINKALNARLAFMKRAVHPRTKARLWNTFGRGWQARVDRVHRVAHRMFDEGRGPEAINPPNDPHITPDMAPEGPVSILAAIRQMICPNA